MAEQPTRPQYNVRLREIPSSDRPRERLRDLGPQALTTAELLAIVLRTGSGGMNVLNLATDLLHRHGGIGGLSRLSYADLIREKGVGDAKASELLAVFHLAQRLMTLKAEERMTVRSPQDVYLLLGFEMARLDTEHLRVILVNTKNQVMAVRELYKGNVSSALVRTAEVFQDAIRQNAPSIILVHNHPSGDPTPSPDDVALTKRLVEAGKHLDIEVLDHIVIGQGENRFVSLQSMGLGNLGG